MGEFVLKEEQEEQEASPFVEVTPPTKEEVKETLMLPSNNSKSHSSAKTVASVITDGSLKLNTSPLLKIYGSSSKKEKPKKGRKKSLRLKM